MPGKTDLSPCMALRLSISKIVSEYDQEIPQSQTADNPVAPRGRAAQIFTYTKLSRVISLYTSLYVVHVSVHSDIVKSCET